MRKVAAPLIAIAAALAALFFFREQIVFAYRAATVEKTTIAALSEKLEAGAIVLTPTTGAAPYPVVIQFHGCGGFRDKHQRLWAESAISEGYAAVLIGSYGPRGMTREDRLAKVCTGKKLIGQERAGDVAAALAFVGRRPELDARRVILAGWSHGAWSIMDYYSLRAAGDRPASLTERPPANDVRGAILFYPYCGPGARSRFAAWDNAAPTLALIALKDTIVNPEACLALAERLNKNGAAIDIAALPAADHAFDDPYLPDDVDDFYHAASAEIATLRYRAFLRARADAK